MKHQQHYARLADDFDQVWQFSPTYEAWMVSAIVQTLTLNPQDCFVDFGGGTGRFTQAIHLCAQPRKSYCVEPDAGMCEYARLRPELSVLQADDLTFVSAPLNYDALLVKEVIHHLSNRLAFWQGVKQQLNPTGNILLVTRPQNTPLALFDAAKIVFAQHQPSVDLLISELHEASFNTSVSVKSFDFSKTKDDWFAMLRARFMSDLAGFSDDDIEAGIASLNLRHSGDYIEMTDELIFISANLLPN
jgi:SAM-dependent methyltransferase